MRLRRKALLSCQFRVWWLASFTVMSILATRIDLLSHHLQTSVSELSSWLCITAMVLRLLALLELAKQKPLSNWQRVLAKCAFPSSAAALWPLRVFSSSLKVSSQEERGLALTSSIGVTLEYYRCFLRQWSVSTNVCAREGKKSQWPKTPSGSLSTTSAPSLWLWMKVQWEDEQSCPILFRTNSDPFRWHSLRRPWSLKLFSIAQASSIAPHSLVSWTNFLSLHRTSLVLNLTMTLVLEL